MENMARNENEIERLKEKTALFGHKVELFK